MDSRIKLRVEMLYALAGGYSSQYAVSPCLIFRIMDAGHHMYSGMYGLLFPPRIRRQRGCNRGGR